MVITYDDGDVKAYSHAVLQTRLEQAALELGVDVEQVGGKGTVIKQANAAKDKRELKDQDVYDAELDTSCHTTNAKPLKIATDSAQVHIRVWLSNTRA